MREGLGCRANGASGYRSWLPGRYTIAYNTQLSNPLPERCSGERVGGREGGRKEVRVVAGVSRVRGSGSKRLRLWKRRFFAWNDGFLQRGFVGVKVWGESIWKRKEISRKRNGCVSVDVRNVEIEEGSRISKRSMSKSKLGWCVDVERRIWKMEKKSRDFENEGVVDVIGC